MDFILTFWCVFILMSNINFFSYVQSIVAVRCAVKMKYFDIVLSVFRKYLPCHLAFNYSLRLLNTSQVFTY